VTADEETIRNALAPFLPFHLLVNNAGVAVVKPFLELSSQDIDMYVLFLHFVVVNDNILALRRQFIGIHNATETFRSND
jgi:short-subunit dehydrogenase